MSLNLTKTTNKPYSVDINDLTHTFNELLSIYNILSILIMNYLYSNLGSYQQGAMNESASQLRMSDSYLDEKDDTNLNTLEKRSLMVSTSSFSRNVTPSGRCYIKN